MLSLQQKCLSWHRSCFTIPTYTFIFHLNQEVKRITDRGEISQARCWPTCTVMWWFCCTRPLRCDVARPRIGVSACMWETGARDGKRDRAGCYKFPNYFHVLCPDTWQTSHCAALQTGTLLQSHHLSTVHIRANINTRHSPEHVAPTYPASFCHFALILQSLLRAGMWIIRRRFTR